MPLYTYWIRDTYVYSGYIYHVCVCGQIKVLYYRFEKKRVCVIIGLLALWKKTTGEPLFFVRVLVEKVNDILFTTSTSTQLIVCVIGYTHTICGRMLYM